MTTYPLPTLACTVTSTGITSPSYNDILLSLQASYQAIYGSDVYLGNDSQDMQMLAVYAQGIYDANQATIFVYNQFSPATSQGTGLSSVVKINGLARDIPGNSSAVLTLVGQTNATITAGVVQDTNGYQWSLPTPLTFGVSGTLQATATCTTAGAIAAAAGTINIITNPQLGWQSATNAVAAAIGAPVETDSTLRQRQSVSTEAPSLSILGGILGAVAAVPGVTRYMAYENDTGTANSLGLPPHSISLVVQGGTIQNIANAIGLRKTPGTVTYGTTSGTYYDPNGIPDVINYYTLSSITVSLQVNLAALSGFISTTNTYIQEALAAWLNDLSIGEKSYVNRLIGPANLSGDVAVTATGLTQAQLDALSSTYNVTNIYQARSDMVVTGGPYAAGVGTVTITNVANYAVGSSVGLVLNDGSFLYATVTGIAGNNVTFTPVITVGKTVQNGALMYVNGDINFAFTEAAIATTNTIVVTP